MARLSNIASITAIQTAYSATNATLVQQSNVSSVTDYSGTRFDSAAAGATRLKARASPGNMPRIAAIPTRPSFPRSTAETSRFQCRAFTRWPPKATMAAWFVNGQAIVTNNFPQGVTQQSGTIAFTARSGLLDRHSLHEHGRRIRLRRKRPDRDQARARRTQGGEDLPQSWLSTGPTSQSIGSLAGDGTLNINSGVLYAGSDNTSTTFTGAINQSSIGTGLTKVGNGTLTLTNSVMGATLVNSGPQPIVFAPAASTNITGTVTGGMLVASGSVTSTLQNLAGTPSAWRGRHARRRRQRDGPGGRLLGHHRRHCWRAGNTVNSNFTSLALFNASVNNPTYVMSTTPTVAASMRALPTRATVTASTSPSVKTPTTTATSPATTTATAPRSPRTTSRPPIPARLRSPQAGAVPTPSD